MAKKRQPRTQEEDHIDGQEEATNNTKGQPWPWQWLGGTQPRTQNHGNGKKKHN